jgi:hypothetical protein
MKNTTTIIGILVAGMIIGAVIVWGAFGFCTEDCTGTTQIKIDTTLVKHVSLNDARKLFQGYFRTPDNIDSIRGFTISIDQFNAMLAISQQDNRLLGFRIYLGKDSIDNKVRIIVGYGSPEHYDNIYMSSEDNSGPCPWVCDDASEITKQSD